LNPDPAALSREEALHMAKVAEQAERYEEMVKYMKRIVEHGVTGDELTVEERNLISVGYKNMMSVRRTAWRTVAQSADAGHGDADPAHVASYQETICGEVFDLIQEVTDDVVNKFTSGPQKAEDVEVLVFFRKMEGDYNRYGAEITKDEKREGFKQKALNAYTAAQTAAEESLPTTNPIRLGLALNFSVFHYEIMGRQSDASELAKNAFDQAIDHLDTLAEDAYKDSTLIMQLLKDNLTLWNESNDDDLEVQEVDDPQ